MNRAPTRMTLRGGAALLAAAAALTLAGCKERRTGPIEVSAIGGPARLVNPNLERLDPPSAFLLEAAAQGLVRFDGAGEIEPALAQSWIVSDDGLRYTFRIRRAQWSDGSKVTAEQIVERLRAAISRASSNRLKSVMSAVTDIQAMTDEVLEITLSGPRPNVLQLLAQPEMAILSEERGTGPYAVGANGGLVLLAPPREAEEMAENLIETDAEILLRAEPAALAVARFREGLADLVIGGTAADLPIALAAAPAAGTLRYDTVSGLFGLGFERPEGALAEPEVRRALSMAVDREALAAALRAPGLAPRIALVAPGTEDVPSPAEPDWAASPLAMRRELAARAIAALERDEPLSVRVALPEGPGMRLLFAHLRRDWRLIGVEAQRVAWNAEADLRLIDEVAPATLGSWYLRRFACGETRLCEANAAEAVAAALEASRVAASAEDRRSALAAVDGILTPLTPFIPLTPPVRWSLVAPRLTGFRPNLFARHPASELIAERE